MKVDINLDFKGKPYLTLIADSKNSAADKILEYFIREAKYKGVKFVNEANPDTRNDYATIRIKEIKEE